ncbi:MAG: hypothetical protein AB1478_12525, partial [Nitrospirota bacterium]
KAEFANSSDRALDWSEISFTKRKGILQTLSITELEMLPFSISELLFSMFCHPLDILYIMTSLYPFSEACRESRKHSGRTSRNDGTITYAIKSGLARKVMVMYNYNKNSRGQGFNWHRNPNPVRDNSSNGVTVLRVEYSVRVIRKKA